jgi:hypothetical protein
VAILSAIRVDRRANQIDANLAAENADCAEDELGPVVLDAVAGEVDVCLCRRPAQGLGIRRPARQRRPG